MPVQQLLLQEGEVCLERDGIEDRGWIRRLGVGVSIQQVSEQPDDKHPLPFNTAPAGQHAHNVKALCAESSIEWYELSWSTPVCFRPFIVLVHAAPFSQAAADCWRVNPSQPSHHLSGGHHTLHSVS